MKKFMRYSIRILPFVVVIIVIWYVWPRLPIITAFAAKGMCSSVFLANKEPERILAEDLSFFPISLAKTKIDYKGKSVTATVFGLAKRKAVYREGLGSVIVLKTPEDELRKQSFKIPDPGYSQDTIPWPKGDVLPRSLPEGTDYKKLEAIIASAFDVPGSEAFKKTLAVAVVYDGILIAEKYLDGYDANTLLHGWSMTKSLSEAQIGILVGDSRLDIHAPVDIPEWASDSRKNTSIDDLLHMSSGLSWVENYFDISEATLMLMNSEDMFSYVVSCKAAFEPGTKWYYSSGDANLVSGLIRKTIGNDKEYHSFPYTKLLHRIGMLHTKIETDAKGMFVVSSYTYGSLRDWARFGLLYLYDGVFAGDTILPAGWVDYSRKAAPASGGYYAASFWLQEDNPLNKLTDIPGDVYFADGFLGQRIYIIPSKKLVVVRMGFGMKNLNINYFLRDIISCLPKN